MAYRGKAATVGNSKALRLDSALFREHPEFATGEFEISVIAPGCMLVRSTEQRVADSDDAVLASYLRFVEHQMSQRPDLITPVTAADRRVARTILRGVRADPNTELGDAYVLPGSRTKSPSVKRAKRVAER